MDVIQRCRQGLQLLALVWLGWALPSAATTVQPYHLGRATISQAGVPTGVATMPIPLTGTLAIPSGLGPFPLVVVLHGRHPGCHLAAPAPSQWPCSLRETRYDKGFDYLARSLAEAGYLTIIPNLNGAYADAYGATNANRNRLAHQRGEQIVAAHLQHLAAAQPSGQEPFPSHLSGQVQMERPILIGHSLGGSLAVSLAHRLGVDAVAGLLLLAPTPSLSIASAPDAYRLPDVPTSIIAGSCDRDVFDLSSLYYFETAQTDPQRSQSAGTTLLLGGNHNFFNAAVVADDYRQQPDNAPQCGADSLQRLSRSDQMAFTAAYAQAFAAAPSHLPGSDPTQAAPSSLFGVDVITNLTGAQQRTLFQPGDEAPHSVARLTFTGLDPQFCPLLSHCGPFWRLRPRFPAALRLSWRQPAHLRWQPSTPLDARPFASLQLRLAVDSSDVSNQENSPSLSIVLEDHQGHVAAVAIPATTAALRQFDPDPRWGYRAVPAYPSAVRIPLRQFQGVNLGAIAAVELRLDTSPQGTLELAHISLIGPSPPP